MKATLAILIAVWCTVSAVGAQLRPETLVAFDHYVQQAERRIAEEQSSPERFLWIEGLSAADRSDAERRMRSGEVPIKPVHAPEVPGGLIHDWVGMAFIRTATVEQVLAQVEDYDHLSRYYSPQVVSSRLLSHEGNDFRIAMRLREVKIITVIMDTEYQVHYGRLDPAHWFSDSRSTRATEIADAGTSKEHALPAGQEHGFLWRLNSYWRFVQAADGVFIQCEAISLTRDIPTGLGWLVKPFVQSIPRESLQFTLNATRRAVEDQTRRAYEQQ